MYLLMRLDGISQQLATFKAVGPIGSVEVRVRQAGG